MIVPILALAMMQQSPLPFTKGSDLYSQCKNWVALVDKTRGLTDDETYQAGECNGYVDGMTSGLTSMRIACPPPTATIGTLIRVYLVYVDAHPKVLDFGASAGMYGALKEAYPCPAK